MRPLEPGMPGVLDVYSPPCGSRRRIAECARCGLVKPVGGRGLCGWCGILCRRDGTLAEYGYVKADRLADYAALRNDLGLAEAAARVGVSRRTGHRYEAALREAAAS